MRSSVKNSAVRTLGVARIALVALALSLFYCPPGFVDDTSYTPYEKSQKDITLTGRVYHTAPGKVVVEAWPRPRKLNLKVDRMSLRSPSGAVYRSDELDNFPMRELPKRRSGYRKITTSWLKGFFVADAYANCGTCGVGEGGGSEEDKAEHDRRSAEAAAGFGLLMGIAAESDKEWVTAGTFSVKEEPGEWTAMIDVVDGKGASHRFNVPVTFSEIAAAQPLRRPQDAASVSGTDPETGLTTTTVLNPDGSRTKTITDGTGKVVSRETRPPPPAAQGTTRTFLDPETGLRITETHNSDGSVTRRAEDGQGNWSEGHYYPGGKPPDAKTPPPETPAIPETPETPPPPETPVTPETPKAPEDEGLTPPQETPHHPATEERHPKITTGGGVVIVAPPITSAPPPEPIPVRLGIDITKCAYPWMPEKDNTVTFTAKIYRWVPGQGWVFPGPPRVITFDLSGVSKEPGICLNKGIEMTPDLYFYDPQTRFVMSGGEERFYSTARTTGPVESATVEVTSDDYGSFGWIKASAPDCEDIEPNGPVSIPLDDNLNTIADCAPQDDNGAPPSKDEDWRPALDSYNGDGHTNYEEYRGFFVQGAHLRTNIENKDLLVNDRAGNGIGHFPTTRIAVHLVWNDELRGRESNFNRNHATTGSQHGLILEMDVAGILPAGVGARSVQISGDSMGPPRNVMKVLIKSWTARRVAHEMGHSTCVWHHGEASWDKTWIYAPEDSAFYNNRVTAAARGAWRSWQGDPPLTLCGTALPAEFMFHPKGKQQSGDVNCVMKYVGLFDVYADNGWFLCWPPDNDGTLFCSASAGTGFNTGGLVGGDADKGNCLGQMRVNDK